MQAHLRNLRLILNLNSFIHPSKTLSLLIDLCEIYGKYTGIFNYLYNLEYVSLSSIPFPRITCMWIVTNRHNLNFQISTNHWDFVFHFKECSNFTHHWLVAGISPDIFQLRLSKKDHLPIIWSLNNWCNSLGWENSVPLHKYSASLVLLLHQIRRKHCLCRHSCDTQKLNSDCRDSWFISQFEEWQQSGLCSPKHRLNININIFSPFVTGWCFFHHSTRNFMDLPSSSSSWTKWGQQVFRGRILPDTFFAEVFK